MAAVNYIQSVADMLWAFAHGTEVMVDSPTPVGTTVGIINGITREDGSGLSFILKLCKRSGVYVDVYVRFTK